MQVDQHTRDNPTPASVTLFEQRGEFFLLVESGNSRTDHEQEWFKADKRPIPLQNLSGHRLTKNAIAKALGVALETVEDDPID